MKKYTYFALVTVRDGEPAVSVFRHKCASRAEIAAKKAALAYFQDEIADANDMDPKDVTYWHLQDYARNCDLICDVIKVPVFEVKD